MKANLKYLLQNVSPSVAKDKKKLEPKNLIATV